MRNADKALLGEEVGSSLQSQSGHAAVGRTVRNYQVRKFLKLSSQEYKTQTFRSSRSAVDTRVQLSRRGKGKNLEEKHCRGYVKNPDTALKTSSQRRKTAEPRGGW